MYMYVLFKIELNLMFKGCAFDIAIYIILYNNTNEFCALFNESSANIIKI